MKKELAIPITLCLASGMLMAQAPAPSVDGHKTADQPCQLTAANPPGFNPYQFLPKTLDFTRLNRFPKVTYTVGEEGSVSNVKVLKGTGSAKVDAALVKSIQAWKYKPQPGCKFEVSGEVTIDIGRR